MNLNIRRNFQICISVPLRVFCDETIAALETHTGIDKDSDMGKIDFLKLIVKFWKIVNIKGAGAEIKFKDPLRAAVRSQIADVSRYC